MISNRRFQTHRFFILFSVLVLTCLALLGSFNPASAKPQFSAIAVDARTGKILFSKDIDGQRHPASLTKVMTLYVVFQDLQAGRLKLSSDLKISQRAASMQPTKLGLKPGATIKVEDAIKVLVTRSANDISAAIGENLEGSESNFAARMTRTARSIGMSKSTFKNASGLPNPAQVTTARDMATLSLRIQRDFPEYYHYFRISSFNYGKQTIRTHNRLLGKFEGTDGIKTGYIRASGFNLTTSARRGKKRIVGVVMGGSSGSSRDKYMMSMLERAFPKCVDGEMIAAAVGTSKGAIVPETKVAAVVPKEKPATDKKGLAKKIEAASVADGPVAAGETNFEKLMAGSDDVSAPDTKVLEAKIEETTVASTEGPVEDPAPTPGKATLRSEESSAYSD